MAVDDATTFDLLEKLRTKMNECNEIVIKGDDIISRLSITTQSQGQNQIDPHTGAIMTDARRQEIYDIWIAKARTLLGLPDPAPATPPPPSGNAGQ